MKSKKLSLKWKIRYRLSVHAQTILWLFGISKHNKFGDECCPDFSCCHPELKDQFAKRFLYVVKRPFWKIRYEYVCWRERREYAKSGQK